MDEEELRKIFESQAKDSFGFRRSHKGTYVNPAVARDWKWFKMGHDVQSKQNSQDVS